jgi:hypothetical protein
MSGMGGGGGGVQLYIYTPQGGHRTGNLMTCFFKMHFKITQRALHHRSTIAPYMLWYD